MAPAVPAPAAPRPLPPATTGITSRAPAVAAEVDPPAPTGQATPAALPGEASSPRRAASIARFSAAPAASEGLGAAGRSDAAARLEATVVLSHDAELAGLAGALRSEPSRWALRTAGGEARTAADAAAAWIDALQREATATDGRWAPAGPGDAASPTTETAATLTLLRDGQRRHRFVLKDGRVVWESGGAVRVLPLPPQALQRLVDRLP